jgi:hypothetical protein
VSQSLCAQDLGAIASRAASQAVTGLRTVAANAGCLVSRRAVMVLGVVVAVVLAGAGTWVALGRGGSPGRHGSLSAQEYALAVKTARHLQTEVTGTFIGATAFATNGRVRPWDYGHACPDTRLLHLRLVWKADATFGHAGFGGPPDGPRKAWLVTVDPHTNGVCEQAAKYRGVGAPSYETLLYGHWPARVSHP